MTRILIVGNIDNIHIRKLDQYLHLINSGEVEVNFFHLDYDDRKLNSTVYYLKRHFNPKWYSSSLLVKICNTVDVCCSFWKLKKYDLINIHFLTLHSFFLWPLYRLKAKKIMISPWGSDVYRINGIKKMLYQLMYDSANFISVPEIGFRTDIQQKFSVQDHKIVDIGFGSEMIDYICARLPVNKPVCKKILGYEDAFIITCGYNRHSAQNHPVMIDAVIANQRILPVNTVLFFLFTYGNEYDLSEYFEKLKSSGIKFHIFRNYLNNEELFNIQCASDLFLHIQKSDANSAFMQEFLLCDNIIINGKWLSYPHLEKCGMPYLTVEDDSVITLTRLLSEVLRNDAITPDTSYAKSIITQFGWSNQIMKWHSFYKSISYSSNQK